MAHPQWVDFSVAYRNCLNHKHYGFCFDDTIYRFTGAILDNALRNAKQDFTPLFLVTEVAGQFYKNKVEYSVWGRIFISNEVLI